MDIVEHKNLTEADLFGIVRNNPREMRNRWRGRVRRAVDELSRETDPVRKQQMERSIYLQKEKLKEWEKKCKD